MKREPKEEDRTPGAPGWVATYGDMMSLLLCFFILLVAVGTMDQKKIKVALGSMQGALGIMKSGLKFEKAKEEILARQDILDAGKTSQTIEWYYVLKKEIQKKTMHVKLLKSQAGFVLRMKANVLFTPGSDVLKPESGPVLDALVEFFEAFPFDVRVEGHTDNVLAKQSRFASNWDLSIGRSIAVANYILNHSSFPEEKIGVSGYGDTRPIAKNDTLEGREKNRRVDIVLASPEGILLIH